MKLSTYRIKRIIPGELEYKGYLFLLLTFIDKRCFLPLAQAISDYMSEKGIYEDTMDLAFRGVKELSLAQVESILLEFNILPKQLFYFLDESNADYQTKNIDLSSSDIDNLLDFLPVFYDSVKEIELDGGKIMLCYTAGGELLDVISEEGKKLEISSEDDEKIGWRETGYFNNCMIAHDKQSILLEFLGRISAWVEYYYRSKKFFIKTGESDFFKEVFPRNYYRIADIDKVFKSRQKRIKNKILESSSVIIGLQEWMTFNLDTSTFANGEPIKEVMSIDEWENAALSQQPAWCYYKNNPEMGEKYGKLYNWYAVSDSRGLAPAGWHIPSIEEWQQLQDHLEKNACVKLQGGNDWHYDNSLEVIFSKEPGPIKKFRKHKNQNSSGFSALPGGSRGAIGNVFFAEGDSAYWWTSSVSTYVEDEAHFVLLYVMDKELQIGNHTSKKAGLSVRCIRDAKKQNN